MPAAPRSFPPSVERKMLFVMKLICGTSNAKLIGNASLRICLLLMLSRRSWGFIMFLSSSDGSETTLRNAIHKMHRCLCSPRGCEIYSIIAALMTKPVFNIAGSSIDGDTIGSSLLLMEVNETSFTYIIVDKTQKLLAAAYFVLSQVDGRHAADSIRDIIDAHEALQHDYKQAVVVYNFSESSLVPDSMYRNEMNRDLADLLFGNL